MIQIEKESMQRIVLGEQEKIQEARAETKEEKRKM